jgi:transposase-like protein
MKKGLFMGDKKYGTRKPRSKCKDCKKSFSENHFNLFVLDATKELIYALLPKYTSLLSIYKLLIKPNRFLANSHPTV